MIAGKIGIRITIATALTLASAPMHAQSLLLENTRQSTAKPAAVAYLYPEQITVPAGKPTAIALHFRIAPGLHINSHTPRETELIPTTLTIPDGFGVRLDSAAYPRGADFTLPLDPKTKLNVYTGEFVIQARIVATTGNHLVEAKLRYQACDNNACMPPKSITVPIDVIAK
jgi:hypothetical protein